jgi:transposase-like protein
MNRTPLARRTQIIGALVEGNSIRSTERMTNTHHDTIMRLMVEVGTGCAALADEQMRDLDCRRIEVDEIWSYVGKKQMHLKPTDDRRRLGDQWTFVAIDPQTKLVPAYRVGKRSRDNAVAFMTDLSERLSNRVQISSDALTSYVDAVERAFGADVDYGQIVNFTMPSRSALAVMPLRV